MFSFNFDDIFVLNLVKLKDTYHMSVCIAVRLDIQSFRGFSAGACVFDRDVGGFKW